MTNTIPNVPRELLADLICDDHDKRIMAERHLLAMLANAPSPAGVDGLEVETYLHTMHMELGRTEQFCSKWKGDPFGVSGVDYSSTYSVTSEPLCRLSDAQTIIDGLRVEVERLTRESLHANPAYYLKLQMELDRRARWSAKACKVLELTQVSISLDDTEWGYGGAEKYKLLTDIRSVLAEIHNCGSFI